MMTIPKPIAILTHITGWLLFACLIIGFTVSGNGNKGFIEALLSPQCLLFLFFYMVLFYLNGYLLFPFLYLQKKQAIYFFVIGAIIIFIFFLKPFDTILGNSRGGNNLQDRELRRRDAPDKDGPHFDRGPGDRPPPTFGSDGPPQGPPPNRNSRTEGRPMIDIVGIILFIMMWSLSSAIQILKQWRVTEKRALQAETDRANAELSFLRAQINPHFLFNTLNNIYSLVVTKNDGGPQAIMKLSQILRYVTDEATQDYVPLDREIQCISNYIDLQRLRLNKNTVINFSVTGQTSASKIPPLILMTFIENVFKYGISSHEETIVTIAINADENHIRFFCRNKIFNQSIEERTGVGIDNARKRLQFLYPDMYALLIEKQDGNFMVKLELNTNAN